MPASAGAKFVKFSVLLVALTLTALLKYHWKFVGAVPATLGARLIVVPNCPVRGEVSPVMLTGVRTVTVPVFVREHPVTPSVTITV